MPPSRRFSRNETGLGYHPRAAGRGGAASGTTLHQRGGVWDSGLTTLRSKDGPTPSLEPGSRP